MSLNKSKGNMYPWVTHTWNPIRGECPHGCSYCFMKGRNVGPLRLDEKALATNLGTGRKIFVGSSTDMFAEAVPDEWILRVLNKCGLQDNEYVFQSKNPTRFSHTSFWGGVNIATKFPPRTILGTTLETNREYGQSANAPWTWARVAGFMDVRLNRFQKMVSIEPIMAFEFEIFLKWLKMINPAFVSIGADSKGHKLPEPTVEELDAFIIALRRYTPVLLKKNLSRILLREIKDR